MKNKICFVLDFIVASALLVSSFWFQDGLAFVGALGWFNLVFHDCDKIRESKWRMRPPEESFPLIVQEKIKKDECFAIGVYRVLDGRHISFALRKYENGEWCWVDCNTEEVIPDDKVKNYRLM